MTHHENIRDAVADASLGQNPLTIKELAYAITVGLYQWGDHTKNLLELAKEIADNSGEPVVIHNRAEEGEDHLKQHPDER